VNKQLATPRQQLTIHANYTTTINRLCRIAASSAMQEWQIMNIIGELVISAPRSKIWAALNDPAILARCIEGCDSLQKVNDHEFSGQVTAKIGPVKASFAGSVTLSNIVPEVSYTISGEGKGGVAGFAKGGADVALEDVDGGQATLLKYTARANVGGKLAQLGSRLIEATARSQADKFFAALAAELAPAAAPKPAAVTANERPTGGLPSWLWIGLLLAGGAGLLVAQLS
jgi:uncharacterized protein